MQPAIDLIHQQVILARLADFCRDNDAPQTADAWAYLREKLSEIEENLGQLKQEQLLWRCDRFLESLKNGDLREDALTDFKTILDSYLAPGDYADIAIHLDAKDLQDPQRLPWLTQIMGSIQASSLFQESRKPQDQRSSRAEKLLKQMDERLGLDLCRKILARKPKNERCRAVVLRRIRRNVAEYCSVIHFPTSPDDTLSPFLLPRIEAALAACRRLLDDNR